MSDSTRKLFHQEGMGGARRSDINSDVLHGSARAFGLRPCSYSFKLNRKLRQLARRNALTYKVQDNQIIALDRLSFEAPRTESFVSTAKTLSIDGLETLYVVSQIKDTVALSTRSIPGVSTICAQDLNTYCVLDCHKIVLTEDVLALVNEVF